MGPFVYLEGSSGDVSFETGVGGDSDFSGGLYGAVNPALDVQVADAELGAEVALLGDEHGSAGFDSGHFAVRLDDEVFDAEPLTATRTDHAERKGADE